MPARKTLAVKTATPASSSAPASAALAPATLDDAVSGVLGVVEKFIALGR